MIVRAAIVVDTFVLDLSLAEGWAAQMWGFRATAAGLRSPAVEVVAPFPIYRSSYRRSIDLDLKLTSTSCSRYSALSRSLKNAGDFKTDLSVYINPYLNTHLEISSFPVPLSASSPASNPDPNLGL